MQIVSEKQDVKEKKRKSVETIVNLHPLASKFIKKYGKKIGCDFEQIIFNVFWLKEQGDCSHLRKISYKPNDIRTNNKFLLDCEYEFYLVKINLDYRAICSFGYDDFREIFVLDIFDICSENDYHHNFEQIMKTIIKED